MKLSAVMTILFSLSVATQDNNTGGKKTSPQCICSMSCQANGTITMINELMKKVEKYGKKVEENGKKLMENKKKLHEYGKKLEENKMELQENGKKVEENGMKVDALQMELLGAIIGGKGKRNPKFNLRALKCREKVFTLLHLFLTSQSLVFSKYLRLKSTRYIEDVQILRKSMNLYIIINIIKK